MVKKTANEASSPSFSPAPIFYADQPAALALGPHVSRMSFGVEEEEDGEFPRPVVTIAMPTAALLEFVNDLKAAFDSAEFKRHTVDHLARSAKRISSGGSTTPEAKKITRVGAKKAP
jgi:hypothetical protein